VVLESEASRAAREAASRFGEVQGSSYTTFEERPILWAFDVNAGEHRVIYAGGESSDQSVLLLASEAIAFTAMLHAKSLIGHRHEELEPHQVTFVERVDPAASWWCDSFYVSRRRFGPALEHELLAVTLHAAEVGLDPDRAEEAVLARNLMSTPDPSAKDPRFPAWVKLLRSLRRLTRLEELAAPQIIIDNEIQLAERAWQRLERCPLASWPPDLSAAAAGLSRS
jgi:hypothetical protein